MCPIHVVMWEPAGLLAGKTGGTGTFLQGAGRAGVWGAKASGAPPHMGLSPHSLTMEPRAHIKESTESLVQEPLFNTFQKLQA